MTREPIEFTGLYDTPEAAIFLSATIKQDTPENRPALTVSSRKLIRWIRKGLTSPDLIEIPGRELVISFEDLISMRVIATLRALGVSWKKIHKAEDWLRKQTDYPRPFAIERVWTETTDIFAEFHEGFIAASKGGQLVFTELVGDYLQSVQDMIFIPHNGIRIADTWKPHPAVAMNPRIQFGEPCIEGTRIRTRILWQMWNGGDSTDYLERSFKLSEAQIDSALEWENRLRAVQVS